MFICSKEDVPSYSSLPKSCWALHSDITCIISARTAPSRILLQIVCLLYYWSKTCVHLHKNLSHSRSDLWLTCFFTHCKGWVYIPCTVLLTVLFSSLENLCSKASLTTMQSSKFNNISGPAFQMTQKDRTENWKYVLTFLEKTYSHRRDMQWAYIIARGKVSQLMTCFGTKNVSGLSVGQFRLERRHPDGKLPKESPSAVLVS